jgi:SAM-dependent methyltransferase
MAINKNHWYDGWFYDTWIAPNQDRLFRQITTLLPPDSTVLDVGCGTGRLSFMLADTSPAVLGIDLSKRNIDRAQRRLSRSFHHAVSFDHTSVREMLAVGRKHFDYAVLTYVLHEVAAEDRAALLDDIAGLADRVIIGDYLVPLPGGFWSLVNKVVERVAGRDHYRNFRSFVARGGITGETATMDVRVLLEIKGTPKTSHLVVLQAKPK